MVFGTRIFAYVLYGLVSIHQAVAVIPAFAQESQSETSDKEFNDRIDSLERSTESQMEDAKKAAREALDRLRQGYGELKARASKEWEERRPEYERRLAEAEKRLDDLADEAAEKWKETRQAAAKSLRDLSDWLDTYSDDKGTEDEGENEKPADMPTNI